MRFEIIFSQFWWFSCPGDAEKGELEGRNQICVKTQPLCGRWFNQSFALGPAELIFNQYIRANMLIRAQFPLSVPAESTNVDRLKTILDLQSHSIILCWYPDRIRNYHGNNSFCQNTILKLLSWHCYITHNSHYFSAVCNAIINKL